MSRDSRWSDKLFLLLALGGALGASAVDGTWAKTGSGTWTDTAGWVDGIIPDGGFAHIGNNAGTINVGTGAPAIGGVVYTGASQTYVQLGSLPLVAPARFTTSSKVGNITFRTGVLSSSGDVTVTGPGYVMFEGAHALGGRTVISNGWVRFSAENSFGSVPATLVSDAIVLDGGCLQNGRSGTTTLPATRGVYVTEAGGYFCAGFENATFLINAPITGPGGVGLNYEFSETVLANPANDWRGDTVLGTDGVGANPNVAKMRLGADEVIPHGAGRGRLRVGPENYICNANKAYRAIPRRCDVQFDLAGHAETVNAFDGGCRTTLKSTAGASTLTLAGDGNSYERGTVAADVTLAKQGAGVFEFSSGTLSSGAGLTLDAGRLDLAPFCAKSGSLVTCNGGTLRLVPYAGLALARSATATNALVAQAPQRFPAYGGYSVANAGERSVYTTRWTLDQAGTYSFLKSFGGKAKLVIDGTTVIDDAQNSSYRVVQDVALAAGDHVVELTFIPDGDNAGAGVLFSGIMYDAENGAFATDEEKNRARYFGSDIGDTRIAVPGDASPFVAGLRLNANCTLEVDPGLGPITLAGPISSPNGSTLTIPASAGPVTVGSADASAAPVLDATIDAQGGLTLTNNVWLRAAPPAGAIIAPGTAFTLDYADAFASTQDLSTSSARMTTQGLGDGTIVVHAGQTFRFDTQVYADGLITDGANQTRAYANDIVLDGGTLYFSGAGTITYTGRITGQGRIERQGTGAVVFNGDASALTAGTEIVCSSGAFLLGASGTIGDAKIGLWGGRFGVADGLTRTVANPVDAHTGGFQVGAGARLELSGFIKGFNGVSLWGTGTLALVGEGVDNTVSFHVRGGVLELAKSGTTVAVAAVQGCVTGAVTRIAGNSTRMIQNSVRLDGGTLDLNGHDLRLNGLWDSVTVGVGGFVVNNGAVAATLTIDDPADSDHTFSGDFLEGTAPLTVVKSGSGRLVFGGSRFKNAGFAFTGGTTRVEGAPGVVARGLRFTALKSRPGGQHAGTGIQFSEFVLLKDGVRVPYPAGATATAPMPGANSAESAAKAIDNDRNTKWYAGDGSLGNCVLTIDFGQSVNFDAYQFATANDATGRDPYSWKIEVNVDGSTWVEIDRQENIALTETRNALDSHTFPVSYQADAFGAGMDVEVASGATLGLTNVRETFEALTGGGVIDLDASDMVLAGTSVFTGAVVGTGTVVLDGATDGFSVGEDVVVTTARATELVYGASAQIEGVLTNGVGALALTVDASNAVVRVAGRVGNDYTGATTIRQGSLIVSRALSARYFRYHARKMTNGGTCCAQLSRIDLRCGGVPLAWPAGTVATTSESMESKGEGPMQLLDGQTGTKCFWGSTVHPVVITCPAPVAFDGYDWYTANDSISQRRQPVSWTFEYSNDGVVWTLFDQQTDNPDTPRVAEYALAYAFDMSVGVEARNALPDASAVTVASAGTLTLDGVQETIGALAGGGVFEILQGAEATIDAATDAAFTGPISGAGTLAKAGAGTQALSGAITLDGTLIVEAGVLDLTGATLTGVTNIVLRGGALVGAATVTGDLTVNCEGGAYGASLTVSGRLTLAGTMRLLGGCTGTPVRMTSFSFANTDAASLAIYKAALLADTLPRGWAFSTKAVGRSMAFTIATASTILYIR